MTLCTSERDPLRIVEIKTGAELVNVTLCPGGGEGATYRNSNGK